MNVVIAAAGKGTRMHPIGISTPKALIPILNKPLLLWDLDNLPIEKITRVYVIISTDSLGEMINSFVESIKSKYSFKIETVIQKEQRGTADALQSVSELVKGKFLFLNGDDLYGAKDLDRLLDSESFAILTQEVTDPEKFGIAQTNPDGNLIKLIEKPSEFVGNLAYVGAVTLDDSVFEIIREMPLSERGELELTDAINHFCEQKSVNCIKTIDYWIPIGYPWSILDATEKLIVHVESDILGTVEQGVNISGKLVLPASSTIKSGSHIDGNVVIGENSTIGPNAYVRGNVVLGNDCKIGFSSEVKTSVIMDGSKLPHFNYVGDSVIGKNVNFGAHAVVSNFRHDAQEIKSEVKGKLIGTGRNKFGSIIGDNVHLGISTLIYPGRKIWPNTNTDPGFVVKYDEKSLNYNNTYSHLFTKPLAESGFYSIDVSKEFYDLSRFNRVIFLDLDHTVINTDNLKQRFNDNFAEFNKNFFPNVWMDTYISLRETSGYEVDRHFELLKERLLLEGDFVSSRQLWDITEKTIENNLGGLIYDQIRNSLHSTGDDTAYIILTSGEIEFQKMKVKYFLNHMDKLPLAAIFVNKSLKGPVINEVLNLPLFTEIKKKELIFADDLSEELESIYEHNKSLSPKLIHVFNAFSKRTLKKLSSNIPSSISQSVHNFSTF